MFDRDPNKKASLYLKQEKWREGPGPLWTDKGDSVQELQVERLKGVAFLPGTKHFVEFIFDTGAYLSFFPRKAWEKCLQGNVEWVSSDPQLMVPVYHDFRGLGGGVIQCRLGFIELEFRGSYQGKHYTFQRKVFAGFGESQSESELALLGLGGGVHLSGGTCLQYDSKSAWLVDF